MINQNNSLPKFLVNRYRNWKANDYLKNINLFKINSKYDFLDKILLRVLKNNSNEMGNIFFKVFNSKPKTAINFLSNKSSFFEDLEVILKMPKWKFLKELI